MMSEHEQEDLPDQDPQHDEDGVLDPGLPVFEVDLPEKELGRQGAGRNRVPRKSASEKRYPRLLRTVAITRTETSQ